MLTMAVGHSDELDSLEAIGIAIEQCRESLGGAAPQAALLMTAFGGFSPAVVASIREAFPGVHVVGSIGRGGLVGRGLSGGIDESRGLRLGHRPIDGRVRGWR